MARCLKPISYSLPPTVTTTSKNNDGSIDLWFGPNKPDGVADSAFIKTVPDRNFLVALRLYGTEDGFYDQTWVPDDLIQTNK
jgi:hypothetical protein